MLSDGMANNISLGGAVEGWFQLAAKQSRGPRHNPADILATSIRLQGVALHCKGQRIFLSRLWGGVKGSAVRAERYCFELSLLCLY